MPSAIACRIGMHSRPDRAGPSGSHSTDCEIGNTSTFRAAEPRIMTSTNSAVLDSAKHALSSHGWICCSPLGALKDVHHLGPRACGGAGIHRGAVGLKGTIVP